MAIFGGEPAAGPKPVMDYRSPIQFQPFGEAGEKAREAELMRMLAQQRGRGGQMSDPAEPSQRPPDQSFLTQPGGMGNARMRAAALIRQKLRERMGGLPGEGMHTRMGA